MTIDITFIMPRKQPPARSRIKRNLYRLMVARSDIDASLRACELIIQSVQHIKDDLYYPLFAALVICYARPFTANQPHGALPQKWHAFDNPKHVIMHEQLLKARHELIAHSDMTTRKAQILAPGVLFARDHNGTEMRSQSISSRTSFYLLPLTSYPLIHDLIQDLSSRIHTEVDRLLDELYMGMELPHAAFDLRIDEGL